MHQRRYKIINIPHDFLHTNAHQLVSHVAAVLKQGLIEPPKAARGHTMYVDGKSMAKSTKNRFLD